MRNALLTIVILSSLAIAGMAADRRDDGQQQSKQVERTQVAGNEQKQSRQAEHTQVARYDADKSSKDDHASSGKTDCTPKPEGDPEAPQNKVEYGGGG